MLLLNVDLNESIDIQSSKWWFNM